MTNFSNTLQALRTESGLSQQQLADILKVSKSRISMYEQGRREPDLEMLIIIADYFDVSLDYLLGRTSGSVSDQAVTESSKELKALLREAKELDANNIKLLQEVAKAMIK